MNIGEPVRTIEIEEEPMVIPKWEPAPERVAEPQRVPVGVPERELVPAR